MYMENPAQIDMVALIAMGLDQHRNPSVAKVALVVEKAAKVDMEVAVPSLGNYPVVTMEISR